PQISLRNASAIWLRALLWTQMNRTFCFILGLSSIPRTGTKQQSFRNAAAPSGGLVWVNCRLKGNKEGRLPSRQGTQRLGSRRSLKFVSSACSPQTFRLPTKIEIRLANALDGSA